MAKYVSARAGVVVVVVVVDVVDVVVVIGCKSSSMEGNKLLILLLALRLDRLLDRSLGACGTTSVEVCPDWRMLARGSGYCSSVGCTRGECSLSLYLGRLCFMCTNSTSMVGCDSGGGCDDDLPDGMRAKTTTVSSTAKVFSLGMTVILHKAGGCFGRPHTHPPIFA